MTTNQFLGGLAIFQLVRARRKYRGVRWFLFVFFLVAGVVGYYVVSRLFVVWPYRLCRHLTAQ
jgi:hypothetical protein